MVNKVAVIGATGNVGREVLSIMAERSFPAEQVVALASSRSVGIEVSYGEKKTLKVQNLETYDFNGTEIALSSPGAKISAKYCPKAARSGCVVIDNTSYFRMEPDVPLIVPEVNLEDLAGYTKRGIVANPNCSTIQMVTAIKPLHDYVPIKRIVVSTYQSVSGAGKGGMDELFNQTRGIYVNEPASKHQEHFTKQISFNVIPHIDIFMDDGSTKEEWKMVAETKKILDPDIQITATCARVPVFIGHAESINLQFDGPIDEKKAIELLKNSRGVSVVDHREDGGYVTPQECAGEDPVFISRIRNDPTIDYGLNMWVVSDNLRKGAALNTVQIAENLIDTYLV